MYQERSLLLIHFFFCRMLLVKGKGCLILLLFFALLLYIIRLIPVQFALRGLLEKDSVTQGDI